MIRRAIAIRHVAFEDLGLLAGELVGRGYSPAYYEAGVDDLASIGFQTGDVVVILGGPIGAYEEKQYPFVLDELRLIERALKIGVPLLGICLGAQLCARALGASVYPGARKEIGIHPIRLSLEGERSCLRHLGPENLVLHWHGDVFDLPDGARRLAETDVTPNQAFSYGDNVLGLQFHIEAEPAQAERWLIGHACELAAAGIEITGLRNSMKESLPGISDRGRIAIGEWLDSLIETRPGAG